MNPYVKRQTSGGSMVDYLVVEGLIVRPSDASDALATNQAGGFVTPNLGTASATSIASTGAIVTTSPSGGFGYAAGAGGAVTQGTSIVTTVVLATLCGTITTFAAAAIAGAEDGPFTVTNTSVAATDVVNVSIKSYAGAGTPFVWVSATAAGSFAITITNLHAANALNAAIVFNFAVLKGVAA